MSSAGRMVEVVSRERALRCKLVQLLKADHPTLRSKAQASDWLVDHLSFEELRVLTQVEEVFGESALAGFFVDALVESGIMPRSEAESLVQAMRSHAVGDR